MQKRKETVLTALGLNSTWKRTLSSDFRCPVQRDGKVSRIKRAGHPPGLKRVRFRPLSFARSAQGSAFREEYRNPRRIVHGTLSEKAYQSRSHVAGAPEGIPFVSRKITAGEFSKTAAMKQGVAVFRPLPPVYLWWFCTLRAAYGSTLTGITRLQRTQASVLG